MTTVNTTAATVFSSFFSNKEEYLSFKAHWKDLAKSRSITAVDAALRMLVLGQDVERSMPPTKNPVRIANGALNCCGVRMALLRILTEARSAERLKATEFTTRWAAHGISQQAMASLSAKATVALEGVR